MTRIGVDLDLLDETVQALQRCQAELDDVGELVRARVAALHEAWTGLAAAAQLSAQAEWDRAHQDVHAALVELTDLAHTAHQNYTGAVEANVRMWTSC